MKPQINERPTPSEKQEPTATKEPPFSPAEDTSTLGKPALTFGVDPTDAQIERAKKIGALNLNIDSVTAAIHSLAFRKIGPTLVDDFAEFDEKTNDLPHGLPDAVIEDGVEIPIVYRRVLQNELPKDPLIPYGLTPVVRGDPRFKDCLGPFADQGWLQQGDSVVCFIAREVLRRHKQRKKDQHLGAMIKGLEYREHKVPGAIPGVDGKYTTDVQIERVTENSA